MSFADITPLKEGGWVNPPIVKDAVLGYMRQVGAPMLLKDFRPLGLPRTAVNRVLDRALHAGDVTRRPMLVDYTLHAGMKTAGLPARRKMFLYTLTEQGARNA